MTIFVPGGNTNLIAMQIPSVVVQNFNAPGSINPVDVGIIAAEGTANYGPVNTPVPFSTPQEASLYYGNILNEKYNLMTFVDISSKVASGYGGSPLYLGVRVTDGTDTASSGAILDAAGSPTTGFTATAIYTGSYGDNTSVQVTSGATVNTSKVVITQANNLQASEIFDNISGSGYQLWYNIVDAINNGQSGIRPLSALIVATLRSDITDTQVNTAGSYATKPTATATDGSGATLSTIMKGVSAAPAAGGSGYVVDDLITLAGGTSTAAVVLRVTAVSSGAVTASVVQTAGSYTVLPSSPVAQASTTGSGTGATFTVLWGVLDVTVSGGGVGYKRTSILQFAGGGGTGGAAGIVFVGSSAAPASAVYALSGGTDGNDDVDSDTLIGNDAIAEPTGMYSFRNTSARILVLVDLDDTDTFSTQLAFCRQEAKLGCGVVPIGTTTPNTVTLMQSANAFDLDGYFKVMNGDYIYYQDITNNLERAVSPQGYWAGLRAILAPEQSTLNKQLYTIYATQRSRLNQQYQPEEILALQNVGVDYIGLPPPGSNLPSTFTCRLGINTSPSKYNWDDHTMMLNFFIGFSVGDYLEPYIGKPQTDSVQEEAATTIQVFLQSLVRQQRIGNLLVPGQLPYLVVCNATNNPNDRTRIGIMTVDLNYADNPIIRNIVVNQTRNGTALAVTQPTQ